MPSMSENAMGPIRCWKGSRFELRPAIASGWSGPTAAARPPCCESWPARTRPTPARVNCHPTAHVGYLEQQPDFEPGRTLHDEARSALADLLSLQHEAEEVAAGHRRSLRSGRAEAAGQPLRSSPARTASPGRLQPRPPHRAGSRRPAVPPRGVPTSRWLRSAAASRTA